MENNYCKDLTSLFNYFLDVLSEHYPSINGTVNNNELRFYVERSEGLLEPVYLITIQKIKVAYTDYELLKLEIKNLDFRKTLLEEYFPCKKEDLHKIIFKKIMEVIL